MRFSPHRLHLWTAILLSAYLSTPTTAGNVTLRSGFQIEGRAAEVLSVTTAGIELNSTPSAKIKEIYVIDDGLRRVFVPEKQVLNHVPRDDRLETIVLEFNKPPNVASRHVAAIGSILKISSFDEYGRRVFKMSGPQGELNVIQGITQVTSRYVKIEGLQSRNPYVWDMRVATSSIPRDVLTQAIMQQIDPDDPDQRLKLYRLYTEAERYTDARVELERLLSDFPSLKQLSSHIQTLKQLRAGRLVKEIELLKESGQHKYAFRLLNAFPNEGVAAETLLKVRDMLKSYENMMKQHEKVLLLIDKHQGELTNAETRADVAGICLEIKSELNIHTMTRMAAYLRLSDDASLASAQKLSLAVSGWMMGQDKAAENMAVSAGLCRARPHVVEYLQSKLPHVREEALSKLRTMEGVSPATLDAMLKYIKPPGVLEGNGVKDVGAGQFEITTRGPEGEADVTYLIQLPPEYSPHRRYPCVLTLHGGGSTAEMQVDWWAGTPSKRSGRRMGQATRHGYIVVAPRWTKQHQRQYEYSFREHAIALTSLRDACKRLSIDTDRVFLSGHSIGGNAAWDIGLAHPDLWAGVIPIVASAGKYVSRYWENGRGLPMYFVTADMDAGRSPENAREWDRYLTKPGYDCIVAEYRGRGHEHFQDEIQHLFRWMKLNERDFSPRQIKVVSMRNWDSFFWFLEMEGLPERSMVPPAAWPNPKARPISTEAQVFSNNHVSLTRCAARKVTVYLSPDMIQFEQPYQVTMRSRRLKRAEPDIVVLLEDVRTRGDRMHPFWAKVTNE